MQIVQIKIQLDELEMTAHDIAAGDLTGEEAALEIMQRVKYIREHLPADRGGWKNPASAENGKRGGRPKREKAAGGD